VFTNVFPQMSLYPFRLFNLILSRKLVFLNFLSNLKDVLLKILSKNCSIFRIFLLDFLKLFFLSTFSQKKCTFMSNFVNAG